MINFFKLFFLLGFLFFWSGEVLATNYYVNDNSLTGDVFCTAIGSGVNTGLTPSSPKSSISTLLASYTLTAADVVYIDAGTYTEQYNFTFNVSCTFQGAGKDNTIFNGTNGDASGDYHFANIISGVTFNDMQFINYHSDGSVGHVFDIHDTGGQTVYINRVLTNYNGVGTANSIAPIYIKSNSKVNIDGGGQTCNGKASTGVSGGSVDVLGTSITANITNFLFVGNLKDAPKYYGGGFSMNGANATTTVNITNSIFAYNNQPGSSGTNGAAMNIGGFSSCSGATLNVTDCIFEKNTLFSGSGPAKGAAVYIASGNVNFTRVLVQNHTNNDGTTYGTVGNNGGTLTITDSKFYNNLTNRGHDIWNGAGTTTVSNTTFATTPSSGFNVYKAGGTFTISNSGSPANSGATLSNPIAPTAFTTPTTPTYSGSDCSSFNFNSCSNTLVYPFYTACLSGSLTPTSFSPAGGTFNSSTGLSINSTTGVIDLGSSIAGTYSVTYFVGGCTKSVSITLQASLSSGVLSGTNSICNGGTTSFSSTISGGVWTSATQAVATINSSTGVITTVSAGTSVMTYTVSGTGCLDVTGTRTVTINAVPTISVQPTAGNICFGGTFSPSVTVTGGTSLIYQWKYATISGGAYANVANGTPGSSTYTNATSNTLTVAGNIAVGSGYYYKCVISDAGSGCSSVTSNATQLTINADPAISAQPSVGTICVGGSYAPTITATGGTAKTYQWQFSANNTAWANVADGTPVNSTFTNATTNTLTQSGNIAAGNAYYYRCVVSDAGSGCGTATSSSAQLTINALPAVTVQSTAGNICVGGTYSPTITATGGTAKTYQWQFSTDNAAWGTVTNGTPINSTFTNGTTTTLSQTGNIAAGSAYYYRCVVSDAGSGCSSVTSNSAQLTINGVPSITVQPTVGNICVGGTYSPVITATGGTSLTYQWKYSTTGGAAAGANVVNATPAGSTYTNATTNTLTASGITAAGSGYYYKCVVSDAGSGCTSLSSNYAQLTVNADPAITVNPTAGTICVGGTYSPTISATGGTSKTYQWQFSSDNASWGSVADGTPVNSTFTNGTTNTLTQSGNIAAGSAYYYRCVVSDAGSGCGNATSASSQLTINAVPEVSVQPTAGNICVGGSYSPTITATGGVTKSYQWQFSSDNATWGNVTNATPANSSYSNGTTATLSESGNVAAGSAYYYRCVVSSPGSGCSTVNSNGAQLTINADPLISVQPSNGSICFGGTYSPSVTITGGVNPTYQWKFSTTSGGTYNNVVNGTPTNAIYSNTTTNTLIVNGNIAAGSSNNFYKCVISDAGSGCTNPLTTSFAQLTVSSTALNTAGSASSSPSLCVNTALTNITHATTGATGISNSSMSGANGLPAGVSATWSSNTITISGTPTSAVGSPFNYSIPLIGGCGTVNATGTIIVNASPSAVIVSGGGAVCSGSSLTLSAGNGSDGTIYWQNTTSGGTNIATPSSSQSVSSAGTYYFRAKSTDGCWGPQGSAAVTVNSPTTPTISSTAATCLANGSSSVSNYSATSTYTFSPTGPTVGAGGAITGMTLDTDYTLTASNATCTSSATAAFKNLTQLSTPSTPTGLACYESAAFNTTTCAWVVSGSQAPAPILSTNQPTCSDAKGSISVKFPLNGTGITYKIIGTNPILSPVTNSTGLFIALSPGEYEVYVIDNGCLSTPTLVNINLQPITPTAKIIASTKMITCLNPNTELKGQGGGTYEWFLDTTLINRSSSIKTSKDGYYILKVTANNGCIDTAMVKINKNDKLPIVEIQSTSKELNCNDSIIKLNVKSTDSQNISWSKDEIELSTTDSLIVKTKGIYNLTIQGKNGCVDSSKIFITINYTKPTLDLKSDKKSCEFYVLDSIKEGNYFSQINGLGSKYEVNDTIKKSTTIFQYAKGENGCISENQFKVSINKNPLITLTKDTFICKGSKISLNALSDDQLIWNKGVINGKEFYPQKTDTFTVTGTNLLTNCSITKSTIIIVHDSPIVFAGKDTSICRGDSILFNALGIGTHLWFDGFVNQTYYKPLTSKKYVVKSSNNSYCTSYDTLLITVNELPTITISGIKNVCEGDKANVKATGANNIVWNKGVINNFDFKPEKTDYYTVIAKTEENCFKKDSVLITVNTKPEVDGPKIIDICFGDTIRLTGKKGTSYTWSNNIENNKPFKPVEGTTIYEFTGENGFCVVKEKIQINTNPIPIVDAGKDTTLCGQEFITLNGSGATTYVWNKKVKNGILFQVPETTTYTVTGTTKKCSSIDSITVKVIPKPILKISADQFQGCTPFTVNFFDISPNKKEKVTWDFGDNSTEIDQSQVSHTFNNPGCFPVKITVTENGCNFIASLKTLICVTTPPIADFTVSDTSVGLLDATISFYNQSINGASSYLWDFKNGKNSTKKNETVNFGEKSGYYSTTLYVKNDVGCIDSITKTIHVRDELIYYVPNTFTPNTDNINNVFKPVFSSGVSPSNYTFLIYNRWGEIIYESHSIDDGWDGMFDSKNSPDGTYVWSLIFQDSIQNRIHNIKGHVNLLR